MDILSYKTLSATEKSIERKWVLLDARGKTLGRLASQVAFIIRGKNKPAYTPHVDCGDDVVIINAAKVRLTGQKWDKKQYISHTGYPGGQKKTTPREVRDKHPERLIEHAVRGLLPKNRLGRILFHRLHVYVGDQHAHASQNPQKTTLTY